MTITILILGCSILIQLITAILALRLIKITRYYWSWILLAMAIGLMAARRIITFYDMITGAGAESVNLSAEITALAISVLMFIGILNIRPLLKNIYSAKRDIEESNKRLEKEVELRKFAENLANANAIKFKNLAEHTPVMIWMSDQSSECTYFNQKWLDFRGRKMEEEKGSGWTEGIHPDDKQKTIDDYLSAFKNREHFELEYRLKNAKGEYRWIYDIGSPMYDGSKKFTGYIGSCIDITERIRYREELKRSEREKSLILEAIQDKLVYLDKEQKVQWTNQAALEILGKKEEEVDGEYCYKLWHGFEFPCSDCPAKKALDTGLMHKEELSFDENIYSTRAYPVEENGRISGVLVIARNITSKKEAEKKIKQSEKKFRMFFNESNAVKLLIDPETGNILDANNSAKAYYGYDDLTSQNIKEINQLSDDEVSREMERAFFKNKNYFNFRHKLANGEIRHVEVHSTPLEINQRKLLYSIIHDITDRIEADQELKRSEEKFRKIVNALPQFVSYVDRNMVYRFVNQAYLDNFNLKENEIIGKKLHEIIGAEAYEKAKPHVEKVLSGKVVRYNEFYRYSEDFHAYMQGTLIPEFDLKDNVEGYYAVLSDVTDLMHNQKLLEDSRNRLRVLSEHQQHMLEKERSYIAREIHDELGQNLTAINMGLSMMKKQIPRSQRDLFTKIRELSHLTQSTLSKTKKLSSELRPQLIDDMGLVAALEWYLNDFEKRSGIHCMSELPDENVSFPQEISLNLFRIIQESLTNVYKHAGAHSVEISLKVEDKYIYLYINDDGVGIGEQDINKSNSLGIMGIEERVRLMSGECKLENTGHGTATNIKIPFEK
jgi:PAS domain S-box-containing protein